MTYKCYVRTGPYWVFNRPEPSLIEADSANKARMKYIEMIDVEIILLEQIGVIPIEES